MARAGVVLSIVLALSIFWQSSAMAYTPTGDENSVTWVTNRYDRYPRGIAGLRTWTTLSYWAHVHSQHMATKRSLYHTSNLGSLVRGWRYIGENVGVGPSLRAVHDALMRSAPHRANILCRCYRYIGTGVVRDRYGYYWVTQIFYG
jgi:uncharacterized protein YkwD